MKVVRNAPEKVVQPPETFDLLGLSEVVAYKLMALMSHTSAHDDDMRSLWERLNLVLGSNRYRLVDGDNIPTLRLERYGGR